MGSGRHVVTACPEPLAAFGDALYRLRAGMKIRGAAYRFHGSATLRSGSQPRAAFRPLRLPVGSFSCTAPASRLDPALLPHLRRALLTVAPSAGESTGAGVPAGSGFRHHLVTLPSPGVREVLT